MKKERKSFWLTIVVAVVVVVAVAVAVVTAVVVLSFVHYYQAIILLKR